MVWCAGWRLNRPEHRLRRIAHFQDRIVLHPGSLESYPSLFHVLSRCKVDECYHLAAQSFVAESFEDGFSTMNSNVNGTHYLLAALRELQPECRFYFAGSSEMFGKVKETPQRESTPFHPRSPYGISKVAGYYLTMNYREAYKMFCVSGLLFNHESPRRGFEFVTRKISHNVARIKAGLTRNCDWAIWKHGETGGMRSISCELCTSCYSNLNRRISWSRPAKRIPFVNFAIWLSARLASTIGNS